MAMLLVTSLGQCDGRMLRPESDAKRLYDDKLKFSGYNKLIRPVGNTSDTLTVRIGLRLTQIIDVVSIHRPLVSVTSPSSVKLRCHTCTPIYATKYANIYNLNNWRVTRLYTEHQK